MSVWHCLLGRFRSRAVEKSFDAPGLETVRAKGLWQDLFESAHSETTPSIADDQNDGIPAFLSVEAAGLVAVLSVTIADCWLGSGLTDNKDSAQ